jgi:hypothetical protein
MGGKYLFGAKGLRLSLPATITIVLRLFFMKGPNQVTHRLVLAYSAAKVLSMSATDVIFAI